MGLRAYTTSLSEAWQDFSFRRWSASLIDRSTPENDAAALRRHFSITYLSMRMVLFLLAFSMPVVLVHYGDIRHGLDFQSSMSAYFWAAQTPEQCATFPMRTIFVGYLFAIGVLLFAYKGLTGLENTLLNLAALCAFAVAVYPESLGIEEPIDAREAQLYETCEAVWLWAKAHANLPTTKIHWIAAVLLFGLLATVALTCAKDSLKYLPQRYNPGFYRYMYSILGVLMGFFWPIGVFIAYVFDLSEHKTFIIETLGVVTFGLYWSVKTIELSMSSLEKNPVLAVKHEQERMQN